MYSDWTRQKATFDFLKISNNFSRVLRKRKIFKKIKRRDINYDDENILKIRILCDISYWTREGEYRCLENFEQLLESLEKRIFKKIKISYCISIERGKRRVRFPRNFE